MDDRDVETPVDLATAVVDDHREITGPFSAAFAATEAGDKKAAVRRLVRKLAVHETAEEVVVHPAVRRVGCDSVAEACVAEEGEAKAALARVESTAVEDPRFDPRLRELREVVLAHAEREEREELTVLRDRLPAEQLARLGRVFRTAESVAPTHAHPHGPDSAVGNMVVGPVVGLVDRARDALRQALDAAGR